MKRARTHEPTTVYVVSFLEHELEYHHRQTDKGVILYNPYVFSTRQKATEFLNTSILYWFYETYRIDLFMENEVLRKELVRDPEKFDNVESFEELQSTLYLDKVYEKIAGILKKYGDDYPEVQVIEWSLTEAQMDCSVSKPVFVSEYETI